MKTLAQHMAFYGCYHRDRRNRLTHFFGVPAIPADRTLKASV